MKSSRWSKDELPTAERAAPRVAGIPHQATVGEVLGPRVVRLEDGREATLALAGDYQPAVSDVLLVLEGEEHPFVIGVVSTLRLVDADAGAEDRSSLRADDGVVARISEGGAILTVRDRHGVTLFTHDARTGRSRVEARGDLELSAPAGCLELSAAQSVRVSAPRVELRAAPKAGTDSRASTLSLGPKGASLDAEELDVTATRGRVALRDATFAADRLETAVRKARMIAGVVETRAERIVERATNVFREVEELSQVRAGRLRMVARGTWSVLSRRSTLKAEEELALLGDKIHLA